MIMKRACLLVTHGSRDPRHQIAAEQLRLQVIQDWLMAGIPIVGTATLELGLVPLQQQIIDFAAQLEPKGFQKLQIIPIFLLAGTHVMEDIPDAVAMAQRSLTTGFTLELCPYLGSHEAWGNRLAQMMADYPVERWIFVSHGSRRASAYERIAALANQIGADLAYWSIAPSLDEQIQRLVQTGTRQIGVLPFLLFPGGITDALQQTCQQLEAQYPDLTLQLLPAIAANSELARFTIELLQHPQSLPTMPTVGVANEPR
jgi:sirohydrochlorin cobaltochelatase